MTDEQERASLEQKAHHVLIGGIQRGLGVLAAGHDHRPLQVGGAVDLEEHRAARPDVPERGGRLHPGVGRVTA